MNRNTIFLILLLTVVWIIFRENFSVFTVITGIISSACCVYFYRRLLPLLRIREPLNAKTKMARVQTVNPLRLVLYPLYLITQVYLAGFSAIKLIFSDADAEIVEVKTRISDNFVRTILANSITLIPGSISLELKDDTITVLWLKSKSSDSRYAESAAMFIKRKLERFLIKF